MNHGLGELVTRREAAARLGISRTTLNIRIAEAGLTTYTAHDRRERLVSMRDLERLFQPRPMHRPVPSTTPVAAEEVA